MITAETRRRIHGYCRGRLRDPIDADDATQETLLRAHRDRHQYDPGRPYYPWVLAIARHVCIDLRREAMRRPIEELVFEPPCPLPGPADLPDIDGRLSWAIAALSPRYRDVIVRDLRQHRMRDIAHDLGLPLGTVLNRLFRARARLRIVYLHGTR